MAVDDDPYTLSPESIFVKAAPQNAPTRLERFSLALIRGVILIGLILSLIGTVLLAYQGYAALNETPVASSRAILPPSSLRFLSALKATDVTDAAKLMATPTPAAAAAAAAETKPPEGNPDAVDSLLNRQIALLNDFLAPLGRNIAQAALYKERQRALGQELAFSQAPRDQLAYASAQHEFLDRVLHDRGTVQHVRAQLALNPAYLDTFMNRLLDEYPEQLREERRARPRHEQEERQRVEAVRAQSTRTLLTALGLFIVFLGLSAVYVLIRIERHLRMGSNIVQVMSV